MVPARSAPPPSPLARYQAQLLARRRLRALAAMTGGVGSAALLALTGFGAPVPVAGAVEVASDDRVDPQAWVLPEGAGMGPLVIPTIGALPPGSADWFLPGAPAAAAPVADSPAVSVSSVRKAVPSAERALDAAVDAALDAELGLDSVPGPSAAPAAPTTAPPPSAADRGESRDQAVAPPTHPAPPAGSTAPATTLPPSGPSSSVQPSPATTPPATTLPPSGPSSSVQPSPATTPPATTLPPSGPSSSVQPSPATTPPATTLPPANPSPTDPTPAAPSPTDPTPAAPSPTDPTPAVPTPAVPTPAVPTPTDPTPAAPSPADPTPTDPPPVEPPPAADPPPVTEPPPVEEPPPPVEEPPPAEPVEPAPVEPPPVVIVPGSAVDVPDPAGGSALTVTVEHVLPGASCADSSVVAGIGTLVAVRITVTTGADLAALGGERSVGPGDFRLVGDDGSVATGGAPAGSCDTGAAAFPGGPLAPSAAVTGTVVLDVPARSGTVVFRPAWL
ncbi:hypothetical protein ACI79P_17850 [Blastococcus sp. SYSU DS0510]